MGEINIPSSGANRWYDWVAKGTGVHACGHTGKTPLHWAAMENHAAIAKRLIAAGSDVNARDSLGRTPLG